MGLMLLFSIKLVNWMKAQTYGFSLIREQSVKLIVLAHCNKLMKPVYYTFIIRRWTVELGAKIYPKYARMRCKVYNLYPSGHLHYFYVAIHPLLLNAL